MNRVLLRLLLLGAFGAAATPGGALAQSAPVSVDKKQVAKQYVDAGLAAQESGDYETAITFYLKAYQLVPHPTLLFNMAQAHRLAGHIDQALLLYKRYLSEDPRGAEARIARQLVSEIETRKADEARKAEQLRKAEQARNAEQARQADDTRKAEQARQVDDVRQADDVRDVRATQVAATAPSTGLVADPPVGDVRDTTSQAPPPPGRLLRIVGLATGAGGAAAVAIGVGFGLHARSISNDLSRRDAVYDPVKVRAGERANAIAIVGMAGGAALIATGAALYWWGYTQGRARERVSVAPLVFERTAGLIVSGALP
jgi:tetratricopeptide (TPR) repeat protein